MTFNRSALLLCTLLDLITEVQEVCVVSLALTVDWVRCIECLISCCVNTFFANVQSNPMRINGCRYSSLPVSFTTSHTGHNRLKNRMAIVPWDTGNSLGNWFSSKFLSRVMEWQQEHPVIKCSCSSITGKMAGLFQLGHGAKSVMIVHTLVVLQQTSSCNCLKIDWYFLKQSPGNLAGWNCRQSDILILLCIATGTQCLGLAHVKLTGSFSTTTPAYLLAVMAYRSVHHHVVIFLVKCSYVTCVDEFLV